MPRRIRPSAKHRPNGGTGDKRGRHKKHSSQDVRRRIDGFERIDWARLEGEGEAA